jgi:multiple sugar transport system substrate-binding protein
VQSPIEAIPERARARSISRRSFLLLAGSTTSLVLLAACGGAPTAQQPAAPSGAAQAGPGGFSGGGSLKIQLSAHFIPAYDAWFDKMATDWGAKNRVEVSVDHILGAQLGEKIASEVAAQSGHDILRLTRSGEINLFNKNLVDVSDLAKQFGQQHGGWVNPLAEQLAVVEGVWKGLPEYFVDFPALYRKDLFDAEGLKPPETWDDLLKAGTILKGKGYPIGIAINQKSNDANNSWNSLLWCYGASFVAKDGKTITINSPEAKEAVKLILQLYKDTMTDEVLSWDDAGNNQMLASGRGSWIHNPISALRTIEKDNPELANKIFIANPPAGPKGRFCSVGTNSFGITSWSQNVPAARAFLTDYYANYTEAVKVSEGYNQPLLQEFRKKPMPILGEDPKLQVLQDFDQIARTLGYPGSPTPASGEVENNWIIPLMIGRAVQDGDVDGAVNWAQQKIEAIYAKYK